MKAITPRAIFSWLFSVIAAIAFLLALVMTPWTASSNQVVDLSITIVFIGIACATSGCALMIYANDGLSALSLTSITLLWAMGLISLTFFSTFVFTDPPETRIYAILPLCSFPCLLLCVIAILLYRREEKQIHEKHLLSQTDPEKLIKALKASKAFTVSGYLVGSLGFLICLIVSFITWIITTIPFPK